MSQPTTERTWESLHVDTQHELRQAADRLAIEFRPSFGAETVERYLASSFNQLGAAPGITKFLPLLAERFTRQRLKAIARIEGLHHDGKPVVLFLCTQNAGRSQMALGFFEAMAGDTATTWSGGSEPASQISPIAAQAMHERGIDITHEFPKPWTDEAVRAADVVVTMGCGDACPVFPGKRYENWEVDDPHDGTLEAIRPIRDDIERRVRQLIGSLTQP